MQLNKKVAHVSNYDQQDNRGDDDDADILQTFPLHQSQTATELNARWYEQKGNQTDHKVAKLFNLLQFNDMSCQQNVEQYHPNQWRWYYETSWEQI